MAADARTPLLAGSLTTLRALGYDERWLQDWLAGAPETLGLGAIKIIDQEQGHSGGGALDLLAVDAETDTLLLDRSAARRDRRFAQLPCLRLLGTEPRALPRQDARRCARRRERYRTVSPRPGGARRDRPLIVIELRTLKGDTEAVLVPEVVVANESLDLTDTPTGTVGQERTEDEWRELITDEAWAFKDAFVDWVQRNLGDVRVNYAGKSYIGVRVGRRTWAPLWPRQDGATVYLPDPDGTRSDEPSVAFEQFEARLRGQAARRGPERLVAADLQRQGQPRRRPPATPGRRAASRPGAAGRELRHPRRGCAAMVRALGGGSRRSHRGRTGDRHQRASR